MLRNEGAVTAAVQCSGGGVVLWCGTAVWHSGVVQWWCHCYSNSTPAAPLLPSFSAYDTATVQLFEQISSEAANATQ